MSAKYKEYQQLNLPKMGEETLAGWEKSHAFEKSVELREGNSPFVFYEGPPSANGMPGIHHVISRTLKDLVCRYKTMQGYQVKRKGGWDTHGLPVELGVEKLLGITKEDIGKKISVEEYNATCRKEVLKYKDKWDDITRKMGYWVDLDDPYITFENNYVETLWWVLSELYKKNLLYESVSIQPYSPAAGTGLSSHELNQPGTYKDVKDTSAVVMFKVIRNDKSEFLFEKIISHSEEKSFYKHEAYFLAWTTTPWTLPSNLGLTVGPNIDYVLLRTINQYTFEPCNVILAKSLCSKFFAGSVDSVEGAFMGDPTNSHIQYLFSKAERTEEESKELGKELLKGGKINYWVKLAEFKGKELENIQYEQLLPCEANTPAQIEEAAPGAQPFKVVLGDFVTTEDGTGIVHTAPAFGADDFKVGKKNNLGILTLVDKRGRFLEGVKDGVFLYGDEYVKEDYLKEDEKEVEFKKQKQVLEANGKIKELKKYLSVDDRIVLKLQEEGKLFKKERYEHNYPHCWRTDKPIIYYPLDAWFIKTTAAKERMVELNRTINWKPAATGTGRFGNWLENMVDWNLSRSRYWGTPLPIWRTEDGEEEKCIGSIAELNAEIKKAAEVLGGETNKHYLHEGILDLHKPYVDEITLVSDSGKPMKRVSDLVDVWFDSGAMPYAQWHYPFENKDVFKQNFPADFIAEGVDQTRGWFYTLHVLGVLLFDSVAYKTVVSNGLVLDKNGDKMSKRHGNVVDPFDTINRYGADATRWYLITNASPWDSLKFDEEGIKEVQRKIFGTLYNTYQFFALYANVDGFSFKEAYIPVKERPEIDRWILSSLNTLIEKATVYFDQYEPTQAGRAIEEFVDEHLSNWYVRLCRRRFWKGEYETDKVSAYQTLYECLETVLILMAPVSPFFTDALYSNLTAVTGRNKAESIHHLLYPKADSAVIDTELEKRMQLAQDLCSLILSVRKKVNIKVRQPLQKVSIPGIDAGMVSRIKQVEDIIKAETNIKEVEILSTDNNFIRKKAKANFKTLGKKLGPKMKWAAETILAFDNSTIDKAMEGNYLLNPGYEAAGEEAIILNPEDMEVATDEIPGYEVASRGPLTVALDVTLTEELVSEGIAREFVNKVQNIRKDNGYALTDRINVEVLENKDVQPAIIRYKDYICAEILADSLAFLPVLTNGLEIEVNNAIIKVNILKKG
ncbi:MAG: isoleucine--tRNA ligase [Ferruginibacter sp.]